MSRAEFVSGAQSVLDEAMRQHRVRRGLTYGVSAFGYSGVVPLYPPAEPASPLPETGPIDALGPQWGGGGAGDVVGDVGGDAGGGGGDGGSM